MEKLKLKGDPIISPLLGGAIFLGLGLIILSRSLGQILITYLIATLIGTLLLAWIHGADAVIKGILATLILFIVIPVIYLESYTTRLFWAVIPNLWANSYVDFFYMYFVNHSILTVGCFGLVLRGGRSLLVFPLIGLILQALGLLALSNNDLGSFAIPGAFTVLYILLPLGLSLGLGIGVFDRLFPKLKIHSD